MNLLWQQVTLSLQPLLLFNQLIFNDIKQKMGFAPIQPQAA